MRSLVTAVVLLAVVPQLHAADPVEWRVVNVHDGDTLTALDDTNTQHRIRLQGIDAPELGQPFGRVSRDQLAALAKGKTARRARQSPTHLLPGRSAAAQAASGM
jgi:endonuclease YncB( thermonuclease family)